MQPLIAFLFNIAFIFCLETNNSGARLKKHIFVWMMCNVILSPPMLYRQIFYNVIWCCGHYAFFIWGFVRPSLFLYIIQPVLLMGFPREIQKTTILGS